MADHGNIVPTENYFLKPGYIFISENPTIISTVLGTSVSVCLYDSKRKVGGMNHFKLPAIDDPQKATAEYGNVATLTLVRMMLQDGSNRNNIEAQIFGGAFREGVSDIDMGKSNIRVARNILARERLQIVSEDVGGRKGRKVVFDTQKNEIAIIKVDKIRAGDWYPYLSGR